MKDCLRMSEDLFAGALRLLLGDSSEDQSLADPEDLPPQDTGMMTDVPDRIFLTFGEPVISYEQVGDSFDDTDIMVRRRLVCGELELAGALAVLGNFCEYFTVIPAGYYGDLVRTVAAQSGVHLWSLQGEPGSHLGDMTSMNGRKVNQRLLSAFHCVSAPFKWDSGIVSDRVPCWVHTCMSSFVWSDNALNGWKDLMSAAANPKRGSRGDVLISLELRTRDCQVVISELWDFLKERMRLFFLIVMTPEEALEIASIIGLSTGTGLGRTAMDLEGYEPAWNMFSNQLRAKLGCFCLIITFCSDDASSRIVVSLAGPESSALTSPRVVVSPMALVGKVVHKLMHTPPSASLDLQSVMDSLIGVPSARVELKGSHSYLGTIPENDTS
jgi:hypothetical protein